MRSVTGLLLQVNMDTPDTCTLRTPDGQEARVVRHSHGSLLFPYPELEPFNEYDLTPLCNEFHAQFNSEVPPGLMAAFNPVYYHADRWVLKGNMLLRLHLRAAKTFSFQMAHRIDLSLLKTWPRVESQKWNLQTEPNGLSPTIGEGLMIRAQGSMPLKVEPFSFWLLSPQDVVRR